MIIAFITILLSTYLYVKFPSGIFLFCELLIPLSKFPPIIFLHTNFKIVVLIFYGSK